MKTVELNTNCGKIKGLELENSLEFRVAMLLQAGGNTQSR